ncbi:MAG: phosphoribosyltransferase [Actinomycetota bacterium]
MYFKNRQEAGKLLAKKLEKYKNNAVIYALPRGGVVLGAEVAKKLNAKLTLVITRKIGHPYQPEFAIAAVAEDGTIIGNENEIKQVEAEWLQEEIEKEKREAARRRKLYLKHSFPINTKGKTAIIIDDGIATGLTIRAAILSLKGNNPKKLIVAVPVAPESTASLIIKDADEIVALYIPPDNEYLGAVGAYYDQFGQVPDSEVIKILNSFKK